MENAQLVGLSRQTALKRQLDVIANNLANMNTNGFRGQDVLFREYLMPGASAETFPVPDRTLSYVYDPATIEDEAPGSIEQTGNDFDVAIDGKGWFAIETQAGERYSRDGAFRLDAEGRLVTRDGNPVLGDGGPITFAPDATDITIARDGTVSSSAGLKGRLRLVSFANEAADMTREGQTLYAGTNPQPAAVQVVQGAIERSNVRPVVEMSRMIEVTRAYTSIAQSMASIDELRRNAIGALGTMGS